MTTKISLFKVSMALGVILALIGTPLSALTSTEPQSTTGSEMSETGGSTWEQLPPEIQAKIDPRIWKELNGEIIPAHLGGSPDQAVVASQKRQPINKTRFLIFLKVKADLKAVTARSFATLPAQRTAVADALIATARATQGPVKSLLDARMIAGSVASYQPFYVFNGFAAEGNWDTVVELAKRDDVERISANYPLIRYSQPTVVSASRANGLGGLDPANWNIDLVDADRVWNELDISGAGAVVGDFDTGVQWDHPALKSQYRGWNGTTVNHNYNWFEPNTDLYPGGNLGPSASIVPTWCDDHGIHTMGTMVGDGRTADTQIGMAPGAKWIAVPGICGNTMSGYWGDDIGGNKAFQWFLCPTDLTGALATRDCSKAPDVVNNSWGSSDPADDTFRPAIQALRAAGIAPVFAAGNPGAGLGSIGSPASNPEAITVGATDVNDKVADFSGRGPSFYEGVQKPNVTAPGVDIKSSVGGSGYQQSGWSGTSMAAPAVSGLVALMISADLKDGRRDLNVDEIQKFIESTAVRLGTTAPNNDYGYGRIDAYNAVRWVLSAGDLRGTVRDANTSESIEDATINGATAADTFMTRSVATGAYATTVPGGEYKVTVEAFGYNPSTFAGVSVLTGTSSIVDFNLMPQPTALLTGFVLSGTTPVNGALVYVDAKPSVSFTTGADGMYTLTLPAGTHALTVKAKGYRIQRESFAVTSGGTIHNLALTPAPTILVVEADDYQGWFGARPAHNFFQFSLDQRDYVYDTAAVTNSVSLVKLTTVMTPTNYDVVIWIHTGYAPNSFGYATLLQNYLNAGGRLIISGQNIGYWDGSSSFYQNYLHATYLLDTAASLGDRVSGTDFLSGLNLTLNEAPLYTYPNTAVGLQPDAVEPRDGSAFTIMTYDNGEGAAALAVDPCDAPYRAVYFAVGYENLGPRAYNRPPEYADVLDRSIQWVIRNKPASRVTTFIQPGSKVDRPGATVNYNLTIINSGASADTYSLSLTGNVWPTQVLSGRAPVTQTTQLAPCSAQSLNISVDIPTLIQLGASDTFTITIESQTIPTITSQISAKTAAFSLWQIETPMPTARNRLAAAALPNTAYYYAMGGQDWSGTLATNQRYNACANAWTSMAPLPAALGGINATALNGKIYVVGGYDGWTSVKSTYVYNPTADTWSSVADFPVALSGVAIAAANSKLYAFGGYDSIRTFSNATYEYTPATNTWTAKARMPSGARGYAAAAELGGKVYVAGGWPNLRTVEIYDPLTDTWSTAAPMNVGRQAPGLTAASDGYLYISGGGSGWMGLSSAERYNPTTNTWTPVPSLNDSNRAGSASAFVAGRVYAVGGSSGSLSDVNESLKIADTFCSSYKQAQQDTVWPGERITYTVNLFSNPTTLANVRVRDLLPEGTTFGGFGPATVSPAPTFNGSQNRVEWTGAISGGQAPVTFTFGVVVSPTDLVGYQTITNTATFSAGGSLNFNSTVSTPLGYVDLSSSSKRVDKALAASGETLTYTIYLANASARSSTFTMTDLLPANVSYVPGSLTHTRGNATYAGDTITWIGQSGSIDEPYAWGDSTGGGSLRGVTYNWIDISSTGIPLNLYDDDEVNVTLPFPFVFYGVSSTALRVGNNGGALFNVTNGNLAYGNQPLATATTDDLIAPFWDDVGDATGDVYYQVVGTAPHRIFVVEWYNRPHYFAIGSATFEMLLHEGSNLITFQYQDMDFGDAAYNYGASATVGIRQSGSKYLEYSYDTPVLTNGLAIQFAPPTMDLTFAVKIAASLPYNTWITNTATITDTRATVYQRSAGTLVNTVALSTSYKTVNRVEAKVGDPIDYAVWLINTGTYTATNAGLSDPIPTNMTWNGAAPTCTSGACSYAAGVITWTGNIPPGEPVVVSYGMTYTTLVPNFTPITNTATIGDGVGGTFTRQAIFRSQMPNLSTASKTVESTMAGPDQMATYTIYLHNSGVVDGAARLVDPIPADLTYVPGSLIFGSGSGGYAGGVITWTGNVPALSQIPVKFRATVNTSAPEGSIVNNTAIITDVIWNTSYQRAAAFKVFRITSWVYLPLIRR